MGFKEFIEELKSIGLHVINVEANAAVNVIVREYEGDVEVLMIKRAMNPNDPWAGDVAFPGGRVKVGDKSILDTALRETYEEVGIPRDLLEIICYLEPESPGNAPEYLVIPVVSRLKSKDVRLYIGPEVEKAFWVKLSSIGDEVELVHPRIGGVVKAYMYDNEIIWGMTKRILDRVLAVYRRTILI